MEDQDIGQSNRNISPVDTQGAFEFKTSINFEFKGVGVADDSDGINSDEAKPLSLSSNQGSHKSYNDNQLEAAPRVHTTQ